MKTTSNGRRPQNIKNRISQIETIQDYSLEYSCFPSFVFIITEGKWNLNCTTENTYLRSCGFSLCAMDCNHSGMKLDYACSVFILLICVDVEGSVFLQTNDTVF